MERGLRFFGHPLHPMLTHFPMALLLLAPALDAVALVHGPAALWTVSFWMIASGVAFGFLVAMPGLVDLATVPESDVAASQTGQRHMIAMLLAVSIYGGALGFRGGSATPGGYHLAGSLACEAIGAILLSIGGWLGGHLVFHHRVGVDEPRSE